MSCVCLERVRLQLVVSPQAEPVPVLRRIHRQELRGQVRREVVLPVRLHRGQVAAVPESGEREGEKQFQTLKNH